MNEASDFALSLVADGWTLDEARSVWRSETGLRLRLASARITVDWQPVGEYPDITKQAIIPLVPVGPAIAYVSLLEMARGIEHSRSVHPTGREYEEPTSGAS